MLLSTCRAQSRSAYLYAKRSGDVREITRCSLALCLHDLMSVKDLEQRFMNGARGLEVLDQVSGGSLIGFGGSKRKYFWSELSKSIAIRRQCTAGTFCCLIRLLKPASLPIYQIDARARLHVNASTLTQPFTSIRLARRDQLVLFHILDLTTQPHLHTSPSNQTTTNHDSSLRETPPHKPNLQDRKSRPDRTPPHPTPFFLPFPPFPSPH